MSRLIRIYAVWNSIFQLHINIFPIVYWKENKRKKRKKQQTTPPPRTPPPPPPQKKKKKAANDICLLKFGIERVNAICKELRSRAVCEFTKFARETTQSDLILPAFWKEVYSKREEFASQKEKKLLHTLWGKNLLPKVGSKFFPFRVRVGGKLEPDTPYIVNGPVQRVEIE